MGRFDMFTTTITAIVVVFLSSEAIMKSLFALAAGMIMTVIIGASWFGQAVSGVPAEQIYIAGGYCSSTVAPGPGLVDGLVVAADSNGVNWIFAPTVNGVSSEFMKTLSEITLLETKHSELMLPYTPQNFKPSACYDISNAKFQPWLLSSSEEGDEFVAGIVGASRAGVFVLGASTATPTRFYETSCITPPSYYLPVSYGMGITLAVSGPDSGVDAFYSYNRRVDDFFSRSLPHELLSSVTVNDVVVYMFVNSTTNSAQVDATLDDNEVWTLMPHPCGITPAEGQQLHMEVVLLNDTYQQRGWSVGVPGGFDGQPTLHVGIGGTAIMLLYANTTTGFSICRFSPNIAINNATNDGYDANGTYWRDDLNFAFDVLNIVAADAGVVITGYVTAYNEPMSLSYSLTRGRSLPIRQRRGTRAAILAIPPVEIPAVSGVGRSIAFQEDQYLRALDILQPTGSQELWKTPIVCATKMSVWWEGRILACVNSTGTLLLVNTTDGTIVLSSGAGYDGRGRTLWYDVEAPPLITLPPLTSPPDQPMLWVVQVHQTMGSLGQTEYYSCPLAIPLGQFIGKPYTWPLPPPHSGVAGMVIIGLLIVGFVAFVVVAMTKGYLRKGPLRVSIPKVEEGRRGEAALLASDSDGASMQTIRQADSDHVLNRSEESEVSVGQYGTTN